MVFEERMFIQTFDFGYYPEIVTNPGDETERLKNLSKATSTKTFYNGKIFKKLEKLKKLLTALALQMGNEAFYNELQLIGIDNLTVEKYIRLLEQSFIISLRLDGFNRNLRNEIKKRKNLFLRQLNPKCNLE